MRRARVAMPVVLLALLAVLGCRAESPEGGAAAREPAPGFDLEALDGARFALPDLRGKVVVVDFWATWCAPCVFQIPVLNAFWESHRGDGVVVLGISVDTGGREVVEPFASEQGIAYPVLLGDEALARSYGAIGYPTLYVVAPDGRIDSRHTGVVGEEELAAAVAAARRPAGDS